MNNKLKVLHVASFDGNIGDVANHNGFRNSLKKGGIDCEYSNLEIRNYYKSRGEKFDKKFVELANQHDLVVFGGGGFFELKWDYSATGTTIDLSDEILDSIIPPILFNGLGVTVDKGMTDSAQKKFGEFLEKITTNSKYFVTVRNDGSYELLSNFYNGKYDDKVLKVPDGGFFSATTKEYLHYELNEEKNNIAINLMGDLLELRFSGTEGRISRQNFIEEFAKVCEYLIEKKNYRIIFVPHIYSDIKIIAEVMEHINDRYRRTRITCAPYCNGTETDGMANFDIYTKCDLVLGMRYHANVVPISRGIPTILLSTCNSHTSLYRDLAILHRCVAVNEINFKENLLSKIDYALLHREEYKIENTIIMQRLQMQNDMYMLRISDWLKMNVKK